MAVAVTLETPSAANATLPRRRALWSALPLKAKIGVVIFGVYILIAIIGPTIAPYDPSATTTATVGTAPSLQHLFGTTTTGQDVFSEVLVGLRSTIVLGLLAATIATLLAVLVGVTAGYLGGTGDDGLMLLTNVFLVLPALPLLIVLLGYLQNAGELATALVLSLLGWAWGARVIRAQTLVIRNREYIAAARETGERAWRIIVFEIVPNEVSLIASCFIGVALYAILTSVALTFLGLTDVNSWSIGAIFYWSESQSAVELNLWWWYVFPGLAVAVLGMSLVLMNYGLDELGNPRLRDARGRLRIGGRRRVLRATDPTPVIREAS